MIVVSDAGPLIYLGAVGHLSILRSLFDRVVVPEAVWLEDVVVGADRPGAAATRAATWMQVMRADAQAVLPLRDRLDPGEAEAIALASAVHADLLLIDDQAGRELAVELGLTIVGTLGVLVRAKRPGLLPAVRPIVDAIVAFGLRATPDLIERVAALAGE
jgi:predicted nucleic acid-binding protein